jgi:phage tail protein X
MFRTASMNENPSSAYDTVDWLGYHVHASCWELVRLIMSSFSAVEENLDIFIKAAREYHK